MQNTNFRKSLDKVIRAINPFIADSWSKRSISLLSLLLGFYFTNSILSFLLDKSINTILLAILILLIMEISKIYQQLGKHVVTILEKAHLNHYSYLHVAQCLKSLRNVQKVTSVGNPFLALVCRPYIVKLSSFTM